MKNVEKRVIIEFAQVGVYVKVSAFHEPTMTEVSIVGDPRETEARLKQTVLNKLKYVLEKSQKQDSKTSLADKSNKRGIIV
ncbi:DUF6898 family protein [Kiloniella antarctica]|uniref:DUF6898 family protein n=1 Tax=Kiloniella antarctica TaxID=1550907 RepID=A0ABW5BN53_9PROT